MWLGNMVLGTRLYPVIFAAAMDIFTCWESIEKTGQQNYGDSDGRSGWDWLKFRTKE